MAQSSPLISPRVRRLADLNQKLEKLVEDPSWLELKTQFDLKRSEWQMSIGARTLVGGPSADSIDQRELDYKRGYFAGVRAVFDMPDTVKRDLADAKRREGNV